MGMIFKIAQSGAFTALHNFIAVFLNRIATGFVQRIDALDVFLDLPDIQRAKFHFRAFRKHLLVMPAQMNQAHARHHLVRRALKLLQHTVRVLKI